MGPAYLEFLKLENFVELESREVGDISRKSIKTQGFDKNSNGFGQNFVHKILSNPSDFHQIDDVSSVPGTPTVQNYAPNEVSRPKSFPRKKCGFCKNHFFSENFHFFRDLKIQKFEI